MWENIGTSNQLELYQNSLLLVLDRKSNCIIIGKAIEIIVYDIMLNMLLWEKYALFNDLDNNVNTV